MEGEGCKGGRDGREEGVGRMDERRGEIDIEGEGRYRVVQIKNKVEQSRDAILSL